MVIAIQNEREWERFCRVVLQDAVKADDPRYIRNSARVANRDALNATIQQVFGELTHSEVLERLQEGSIAYARLNTMEDFAAHPQLRLTEVESGAGTIHIADRPARFGGYTSEFGRIPDLGEHNDAIRREFDPSQPEN